MIIDAQNQLSDAQAVTAAAVSTNSIDLGSVGRDIGVGESLYLVVSVQTDLTHGGGGTGVDVILVDDDNGALSSPADLLTIGQLASDAVAGTRIVYRLSPDVIGTQRYLGVRYNPTGANLTGGNIDAFITKDIQAFTAYPDNITISG